MRPTFLVPESVVTASGESAPLVLDDPRPQSLLATLGISNVIEQESLAVAILGSIDGVEWPAAPLVSFQPKFYTGVTAAVVDLAPYPGVRFLRARWQTNRWGRGDKMPAFTFYLFVEPLAVAAPTPG